MSNFEIGIALLLVFIIIDLFFISSKISDIRQTLREMECQHINREYDGMKCKDCEKLFIDKDDDNEKKAQKKQ